MLNLNSVQILIHGTCLLENSTD